VLAANGVDPERLRVDENGVPAPAAAPAASFTGLPRAGAGVAADHLRLTYIGGQLRLKGVHVLFDAVRRLEDLPGWQLVVYGAGPFVEQAQLGSELARLPVEIPPPFEPPRRRPCSPPPTCWWCRR
jgi:glycosyltransferase involved in cell wall biosynthesis